MNLPHRLLLATDLSPRCDRALERSLQLTSQWGAELLAVHCPEDTEGESEFEIEDFADLPLWCPLSPIDEQTEGHPAHCQGMPIIVANGNPGEVISWAAEDHGCDIIVTGSARAETFWNAILGTTTTDLLRKVQVPILMVRERPRGPYANILVATDFSPCSRRALTATRDLFPHCRPIVFHAYQTPHQHLLSDPDSYLEDARTIAKMKAAAFVAGVDVGGVMVEHGGAASLLQRHVKDQGVELVVVGHGGRNALGDLILGSTARRILDEVGCDCLVVGQTSAKESE